MARNCYSPPPPRRIVFVQLPPEESGGLDFAAAWAEAFAMTVRAFGIPAHLVALHDSLDSVQDSVTTGVYSSEGERPENPNRRPP